MNTQSNISTIQKNLIIFLVINVLLFFIFAFIFDGGAFPWGEIRDSTYLIVTGTKEVIISKIWFWLTYWQGLSVWISIGFTFLILTAKQLLEKETWLEWRKCLKAIYFFIFSAVWVFFLIRHAIKIVN